LSPSLPLSFSKLQHTQLTLPLSLSLSNSLLQQEHNHSSNQPKDLNSPRNRLLPPPPMRIISSSPNLHPKETSHHSSHRDYSQRHLLPLLHLQQIKPTTSPPAFTNSTCWNSCTAPETLND
ncbi:hypothetical protein M758_5G137100, partial [Ceratodon purpureus]